MHNRISVLLRLIHLLALTAVEVIRVLRKTMHANCVQKRSNITHVGGNITKYHAIRLGPQKVGESKQMCVLAVS